MDCILLEGKACSRFAFCTEDLWGVEQRKLQQSGSLFEDDSLQPFFAPKRTRRWRYDFTGIHDFLLFVFDYHCVVRQHRLLTRISAGKKANSLQKIVRAPKKVGPAPRRYSGFHCKRNDDEMGETSSESLLPSSGGSRGQYSDALRSLRRQVVGSSSGRVHRRRCSDQKL